jgi:hypothetical protein
VLACVLVFFFSSLFNPFKGPLPLLRNKSKLPIAGEKEKERHSCLVLHKYKKEKNSKTGKESEGRAGGG